MKEFKRINKTVQDMVDELYYDAHLGDFEYVQRKAKQSRGWYITHVHLWKVLPIGMSNELYLN